MDSPKIKSRLIDCDIGDFISQEAAGFTAPIAAKLVHVMPKMPKLPFYSEDRHNEEQKAIPAIVIEHWRFEPIDADLYGLTGVMYERFS